MTFVELVDNKGWIVESAQDCTVLERAGDGKVVVENITGEPSVVRVFLTLCTVVLRDKTVFELDFLRSQAAHCS